ncbi:V-type ATPase, F subunit [Ancylostoma caninum]|uniref:Endopeptidase Clp n=1 Tax=Ancylostoma caninum TaxID=29170 RepID=A0A368H4W6_ANCCA|nr:V-type ATPase, F subunit [Ancylostoma caninum]
MASAVKGKILAVIGDEDSVVGFLLGGVGELNKARKPNYLIVDKQTGIQEIEDAFKSFVARDDIAIILINQHIAEMIRYAVDQHTSSIPAVLEIPSKEAPYDPSKSFVARDDIAIILINQHIAEMIRYAVDQHTSSIPAVLEIPSKEAPYDPSKDSILNRARGLFNPEDFRAMALRGVLPALRRGALCMRRDLSTSPTLSAIPFVIENEGRGERSYDIYSRLLRDRIVCVMTPGNTFILVMKSGNEEVFAVNIVTLNLLFHIDDFVASSIIAQLLFLQSDSSKKPIHMYINSPGGSVTAGLAIYDTMQMITPPVATWCVGQASSMGSLLLCAGEKGLRTALPNSRIMVHQPSGGASGTCSDIVIRAEEIQRLKKRTQEIYVHHTGQTYEVQVCVIYFRLRHQ